MEKEKTIFDYLGQVLVIYGVTTVILNILCLLFGESAKEVSTMFALGDKGISISISFQFLLISIIVVALRFLCFTDKVIKSMPMSLRVGVMYAGIIFVIVIMILIFGWFPADAWQGWLGFILCFGACSVISTFTALAKDKLENQKMQDALAKIKQEK